MAYYRTCTGLSGKYHCYKQRLNRLKNHEETIEIIREQCKSLLDFFDGLQGEEYKMTPEELNCMLEMLWYKLRLLAEHLKDVLG